MGQRSKSEHPVSKRFSIATEILDSRLSDFRDQDLRPRLKEKDETQIQKESRPRSRSSRTQTQRELSETPDLDPREKKLQTQRLIT